MKIKVILILCFFNIYLITHLFIGKNTIINYSKYKKEIKQIREKKRETMQQRYKLIQISDLLENNNEDNTDIIDELLRQTTQSSLPEEKIVLMDKTN